MNRYFLIVLFSFLTFPRSLAGHSLPKKIFTLSASLAGTSRLLIESLSPSPFIRFCSAFFHATYFKSFSYKGVKNLIHTSSTRSHNPDDFSKKRYKKIFNISSRYALLAKECYQKKYLPFCINQPRLALTTCTASLIYKVLEKILIKTAQAYISSKFPFLLDLKKIYENNPRIPFLNLFKDPGVFFISGVKTILQKIYFYPFKIWIHFTHPRFLNEDAITWYHPYMQATQEIFHKAYRDLETLYPEEILSWAKYLNSSKKDTLQPYSIPTSASVTNFFMDEINNSHTQKKNNIPDSQELQKLYETLLSYTKKNVTLPMQENKKKHEDLLVKYAYRFCIFLASLLSPE